MYQTAINLALQHKNKKFQHSHEINSTDIPSVTDNLGVADQVDATKVSHGWFITDSLSLTLGISVKLFPLLCCNFIFVVIL